jgi:hypothetical protein
MTVVDVTLKEWKRVRSQYIVGEVEDYERKWRQHLHGMDDLTSSIITSKQVEEVMEVAPQ